jgi:hypothetical protein
LVNTSFNVHEEPIVNKPSECLKALADGRIDFVVTTRGTPGFRKWPTAPKNRRCSCGMIVLLENNAGSTAETFRPIIEAAGFSIVFVHNCEGRRTPYPRIYFIGIARRGEALPAWASAASDVHFTPESGRHVR